MTDSAGQTSEGTFVLTVNEEDETVFQPANDAHTVGTATPSNINSGDGCNNSNQSISGYWGSPGAGSDNDLGAVTQGCSNDSESGGGGSLGPVGFLFIFMIVGLRFRRMKKQIVGGAFKFGFTSLLALALAGCGGDSDSDSEIDNGSDQKTGNNLASVLSFGIRGTSANSNGQAPINVKVHEGKFYIDWEINMRRGVGMYSDNFYMYMDISEDAVLSADDLRFYNGSCYGPQCIGDIKITTECMIDTEYDGIDVECNDTTGPISLGDLEMFLGDKLPKNAYIIISTMDYGYEPTSNLDTFTSTASYPVIFH